MTFCRRPLADAKEVIVVQLQLLDLMIRNESNPVSLDAATRADLIDLMSRVVVAVFHEEGGSNARSRIQSQDQTGAPGAQGDCVRQSSEKQVRQNKESQLLQYAVAERVRALGWKQVEIINSDLGSSAGIASAQREGFERVLSLVALGEVGIVASREVSRLSRTDKDWCRLAEVCQIFGTLIGDEQQVYDLNYLDDQLVLGIKGTLSVVELKVLRQRLQAGQESKARRGELLKRLPVGYAKDAMGKVVFHPDQRVCGAIQLVFEKFRERWSVRQTFQWFRDHDVELPANPIQGTRLVWKIPTQSLVRDLLCNPFYAGAYVWGRRPVVTLLAEGRLEKRQGATRRAEDCRVFIPDHHVGYIDWATYEENQRMIRRNSVNWQGDESMTAIRAGQGLLVGLLRCGHCGRKLHVRYWGGQGTNARYLCKGDYDDGGQYCIGFGGASVDRRLGQELLKVISPLNAVKKRNQRALYPSQQPGGDPSTAAAMKRKEVCLWRLGCRISARRRLAQPGWHPAWPPQRRSQVSRRISRSPTRSRFANLYHATPSSIDPNMQHRALRWAKLELCQDG